MCDPGAIKWIESAFGECVVTARDKWSFGIGMVSNLMWVVSSAPQIYQNCKTKRVDGQSPFLFSLLETGNILSLIGIIITHGLLTQIITAFLYAFLDGIMFTQFIYYRYCRKNRKDKSEDQADEKISEDDDDGPNTQNVTETESDYNANGSNGSSHVGGLAAGLLIAAAEAKVDYKAPYVKDQLVGSLFGWISGCVYIGSRIPQVIQNFKNHKVIDLSPIYVSFAIFGNTTYFLSVIIKSTERNYMWKQTPFLFGALGPLSCDVLFLFQMCFLGLQTGPTKETEDTDSDERRLNEL
ncbi:PQ loop repeat-containing protein 2 [Tritrichomonas musculus]|uniref:PQ loop repeat-containing protein 2 n=1 Tax=Tritrichomonas musculus TaxID=1915356 RepID=A0ABR2KDV6_9EUKA